jgi:2-methylisocitrate lyase-like PEP mutase family enzyme
MARTDARGAVGGSFEEAVRRAQAYLDAGADMIFPEGLLTADEIGRFVAAIDAPINYNRTGVSPMLDLDELRGLGVRFVSNAGGTFRAATRAVWDYFHALKAENPAKAPPADPADGHSLADLEGFLGLRQIEQLNRKLYAGMGN